MTKEEAKLVLDSLATWEGEERMITAEHVKAIKVLSQEPCLLNDLEEAAKQYAPPFITTRENQYKLNESNHSQREKRKAFIAGAKWQADHTPLPEDTVLFNKGVEEGKRLMMEEAVEVRVQRSPLNGPLGISAYCCNFLSNHPFYHCKEGDKIKLIIIKEDKK